MNNDEKPEVYIRLLEHKKATERNTNHITPPPHKTQPRTPLILHIGNTYVNTRFHPLCLVFFQ